MIWFFDSWIGGLAVLQEFRKILPEYDYLYFGDNARCPYGGLDDATIRQYTEEGVEFLFNQGATIVILACNTATAHAIRYLQQVRFPDKKILGVTIPGAERVTEGGYRKVGILATESTVRNRAYKERVHIIDNTIQIQEIAAPELVPLIEAGIFNGKLIEQIRPGLDIIDPGFESAKKFVEYLQKHPEIEKNLSRDGKVWYKMSGNTEIFWEAKNYYKI